MYIQEIPNKFQPNYRSSYPGYSSGKNMEEIFYEYFIKNKDNIITDYIYLPIYWTSFYVTRNYGKNISDLYVYLDTLDKHQKYFTIVQYACGIFVQNFDLNLKVFSAGGGGLNIKNNEIKTVNYPGAMQFKFCGNIGDIIVPLICNPPFPCININKDIYCSFMGRFETHVCRLKMRDALKNNDNVKIVQSTNFENYKNILNRSVFSLAPRGFGYTSFRIYEAILAESIPIYIWEDKKCLPFEDKIKWDDIAIIIHSDDIYKISNILETMTPEKINKMVENIRKVKYMFSFDYSFKYICEKI